MAISPNPFALKNLTLDAQELRQAMSSLVPNGGGIMQSGDLSVVQTPTASMTVNVSPGRIWIPGQNTANLAGQAYSPQGMYFAFNDANFPCLIGTASAANPRIDVIYAYVKDSAFGAAADIISIGIAAGAPSSTPQVPALPTTINAVPLAQVAVAQNASSITTANITQTPPAVIARQPIVTAAISLSGWTVTGSLVGVPIGTQTHWSGYIQMTRANGASNLPVSTTAYTEIGLAIPTVARPVGASQIYARGIITGAATYAPCTVFLNLQNGDVQVRADTAVTIVPGAFFSCFVNYIA